MSNIQCIQEHSVDLSLLKRDSKVLDLGCRNFNWSNAMLEYIDRVYCVDADNDIHPPDALRLSFLPAAVGVKADIAQFIKFGNGTGNFVHAGEALPAEHVKQDVFVWTIKDISEAFEIDYWDLIKFDIEGSETDILMNLTEPIADQLTVEMHQHTQKRKSIDYVNEMFDHLKTWYDIPYIDYSKKHGLCENWWDVLMVKRDLIK